MRVRTILAAGLLVVMAGGVGAQTNAGKRPMTFNDLMAMKRVSDPQISPSGRWVLFSVTEVSLEKNSKVNHLWVVPLEGIREQGLGIRERQVTTGDGESGGRFSPDGKWVMYSVDGQIAVASWDDATGMLGEGHAVTSLETGADGAIWAPDSKHFVFVSSVYPECESHAAMGDARNAEEAQCNAAKDAAAAKSPVKAQVWDHLLYRHWDHYVGAKHSHIFYGSVEGGAPEDLTPASVVGDHEAPTFSLGGPLGYAISPDGREIAYEVNLDKVPAESTNNDIYVLQVGAEPGTARKVSTSLGSDDGPAYSPDGKWLAWRSQKRAGFESDKFDLVVTDRQTKTLRTIGMKLVSGFQLPKIVVVGTKPISNPPNSVTRSEHDFDLWVDEFIWSSDSERIFFAAGDEGQEVIYGTNVTGDDLHRYGKFVGAKTVGEWSSLVQVGPGYRLAGVLMRADKPAELAIANLSEMDDTGFINMPVVSKSPSAMKMYNLREGIPLGTPNYLTHLNDALVASIELAPLEPFWFDGANGTKVEGFVVRPPHFDPAKKYPVKFLIHGGPQGDWGDGWSYRWNPELFAADGYVVVMVNPRGSTGYGQRFVDEVSGDWGGRAYVDLMKGLDAAEVKFPFIDKTRECALGASYGGYMADWVLTHTDRFKCIVTHDGMYDPVSAFGSTEELWFMEWEFRPLEGAGVEKQIPSGDDRKKGKSNGDSEGDAVVEQGKAARPWDFYGKPAAEDPFRRWSPMMFIKDARTPTLVIHSQKDYRLDVSQGLQLFTALQLLGVPSKMLYFPDEGHWVLKPQNSELWYETVNDWCDRWTGTNKYAGVGAEKNPMMAH